MKKWTFCIFATPCLSAAFAFAANPRKNIRQANKLAGDYTKVKQARELINEVLADSTFTPDAYTYFVAGKIEREAYRHFYKMLSINRKDPNVDLVSMGDALMSANRYFTKCMALDSVPDKHGVIKVKYSPELAEWLNISAPALYNAGIAYMNKKHYYPKAYNAFMEYASLPDKAYFHPDIPMSDSIRANAYFYGGVMAYNAHEYDKAFNAFRKARKNGYTRKEVFLNQISSLSNIIKAHPEMRDSLGREVTRTAGDALKIHGVDKTPVFIQKYVAGLMIEELPGQALAAIDTALDKNPEMALLHNMKAGVLASMNRKDEAVAEYRKAADYSNADIHTLKSASKYIASVGIEKLDSIKGRGRSAREMAKSIREKYLRPALHYANRAAESAPEDAEIKNTIETVTYRLH